MFQIPFPPPQISKEFCSLNENQEKSFNTVENVVAHVFS